MNLPNTDANIETALLNIVANMPGHVYWKDRDGVYLGCNDRQARSLGFNSADNVIGKTDQELPWAVGVAENFRKNDIHVMETGVAQVLEELSYMDGKQVIVLSQKIPLKNKNGKIVGILGISFDITERKKMEEDLRHAKEAAEAADHAKTEFIANMGHDIRTPLTGIIGMSGILADEVQRPDEKEHASIIHETQVCRFLPSK